MIEVRRARRNRWILALAAAVAIGLCGSVFLVHGARERARIHTFLADLASGDPARQDRAEDALGQIRSSSGIRVIVKSLGDPASQQLHYEMKLVFFLIGEAAVEPVLDTLDTALGEPPDYTSSMWPDVVNMWIDEKRAEERARRRRMGDALQATVEGIGEPAIGRLASMLASDSKDRRRFALDTLRYMEGADRVLIETLRTGDDAARLTAVAALGDRCPFSKVPNLRVGDAAVLEMLVSMLAGSRPGADQAMWVLTQTQDPQLTSLLRPCLEWSDPPARRRAILALAAHGDRSALPLLLEDARSAGKTSGQSLWMLSDYDDAEAVRALVHAASAGEDNLRARASYGLANLATRENATPANRDLARATLRRFLSEGDANTRLLAASAFAAYGMDDADAYYRTDLKNADWHVRHRAASALGMFGRGAEAVSVLVADLEDKSPEVRKSAAAVLGFAGGPEAIESLRRALTDKDPSVSAAAKSALLQVKLREARLQRRKSAQSASSN